MAATGMNGSMCSINPFALIVCSTSKETLRMEHYLKNILRGIVQIFSELSLESKVIFKRMRVADATFQRNSSVDGSMCKGL